MTEACKEDRKAFLYNCDEGNLETVKTFLKKDPSLIYSKDFVCKF